MELKDVILSTLAEIEELSTLSEPAEKIESIKEEISFHHEEVTKHDHVSVETIHTVRDDEARMLEGIRERLLVLFEGFQSPNNVQIEAKVDLTLNFLEYLLATIDHRLDTIKDS
ncbi:CiaD-like domain-containing protein [Sulfuricurvum sp.]|uniref:CiaD-like domain-containing protein n=1 Tax=Sulfuricurvum sp. TaxID=2025608 RepID=UPI003C34610A